MSQELTDREDCPFCKIVDKKLPVNVVFGDEEFLAFKPLDQVSKGHTLLIPKKHWPYIQDIDAETFEKLFGTAQKLIRQIIETNKATGINLLCASGKDAQQSIYHFHLHIVPRYPDDRLDLWLRNRL